MIAPQTQEEMEDIEKARRRRKMSADLSRSPAYEQSEGRLTSKREQLRKQQTKPKTKVQPQGDQMPSKEQITAGLSQVGAQAVSGGGGGAGLGGVAGGGLMSMAPMLGAAGPYAAGAGVALMAAGTIHEQKKQEDLDRYNREVDRIKRQQMALNNVMMAVSRGGLA